MLRRLWRHKAHLKKDKSWETIVTTYSTHIQLFYLKKRTVTKLSQNGNLQNPFT